MAKILIEIPDNWYVQLKNNTAMVRKFYTSENYEKLILEGTPLPKGHGDLIDRNDLWQKKYWIEEDGFGYGVNIIDAIDVAMADTIVEADKEGV